MKLIAATPSPFARKVRVALLERDIPCEIQIDNPWSPDTQLAGLNPLGKVPVLVLDDERTIADSRVIIEYLETLPFDPRLIPVAPAARVEHRRIEAIADGVCDAIVLIVLERNRPADRQSGDWVARQLAKVGSGVGALSRELDANEWFVADRMGLADIAVACMLGYLELRMPELAWRGVAPNLARFAGRMFARPAFAATVPKLQSIAPLR